MAAGSNPRRGFRLSLPRAALLAVLLAATATAQVRRIVVIKVDGLGESVLERWLSERDPKTGKSALPWIEHVFVERGAWLKNFYVRGISMSVPSWSMLDTGHHLALYGNAEYDRATGRVYDYLNFFPFYFYSAQNARADMPAVEVLDQAGIPLLIDRFRPSERLQGVQLFQRGLRWQTLKRTLPRRFRSRTVRELFNEWQTGFEISASVAEQVERELIAALAEERILYLDYLFGDYDHFIHLANDEVTQRQVMQKLDRLVGRIWTAIGNSPLARETAMVMLSDHGMNADPAIYSQGYNLIGFFASAAGGGHHVLTNRHPLGGYKLKGLDPFVSQVVSESPESLYLRGKSSSYPTALLDLDGNERAAIYLRNSDVNSMHALALGMRERSAPDSVKAAAAQGIVRLIDRYRDAWRQAATEIAAELDALGHAIARRRATLTLRPRDLTAAEREDGLYGEWRRHKAEIASWERQWRDYGEYAAWLERMLAVTADDLLQGKIPLAQLIPKRAVLDRNSIHHLQNYVIGSSKRGPGDGVDLNDFECVDYFQLLTGLRVRNNVQTGVAPQPVDFVAARVPRDSLASALPEVDRPDRDGVFVYSAPDRQTLILAREGADNRLLLRYFPVRNLRQDVDGRITFEEQPPAADLPLRYIEDPNFDVEGDGEDWLAQWHTEAEWFRATHRTRYSNAIVGLAEHFAPIRLGKTSTLWADAGADAPLLRRFAERVRNMSLADLLVVANDHWNFNVRGFNPGGNHGSFLRASTHSILMMAGSGVPARTVIERPYDSLSFVPTVVSLMGRGDPNDYPGPVIEEIIAPRLEPAPEASVLRP